MSLERVSNLEGWLAATESEHAAAGRQIASMLEGVGFERVETTTGGQRTAIFVADDAEFAFVPGGEASLGYVSGMFALSPLDVDALCKTGEFDDEEGVRAAEAELCETLTMVLSPRRRVSVAPLLVEIEAVAIEEQALSTDAPVFAEMARGVGQGGTTSREIGGLLYRAVGRGGRVEVFERATLAHVSKVFAERGARLLTEDEWEWCAGGGVDTLYRWGNHMPVNEEPTGQDSGDEKAELLEPNRFGLVMGWNPYAWESCDMWMKGGDGGGSWCGGEGTLRIWAGLMIPLRHRREGVLLGSVRRSIPVQMTR